MLSIVIPTKESSAFIEARISSLIETLKSCLFPCEIIVVFDEPRDKKDELLLRLLKFKQLKLVLMKSPRGQSFALRAGIHEANYDHILTLDDDIEGSDVLLAIMKQDLFNFDLVYFLRGELTRSSYLFHRVLGAIYGHKSQGSSIRLFKKRNMGLNGALLEIDLLGTSKKVKLERIAIKNFVYPTRYRKTARIQLAFTTLLHSKRGMLILILILGFFLTLIVSKELGLSFMLLSYPFLLIFYALETHFNQENSYVILF